MEKQQPPTTARKENSLPWSGLAQPASLPTPFLWCRLLTFEGDGAKELLLLPSQWVTYVGAPLFTQQNKNLCPCGNKRCGESPACQGGRDGVREEGEQTGFAFLPF